MLTDCGSKRVHAVLHSVPAAVAQDCITDDPDQRPSMKDIAQRLLAVRGRDGAEKVRPLVGRADPLIIETADSADSLHCGP